MSKISTNTEVNIDEVEQKTLLTICTTKLHRCYSVTLHFCILTKKLFLYVEINLITRGPWYTCLVVQIFLGKFWERVSILVCLYIGIFYKSPRGPWMQSTCLRLLLF